MIVRAWLSAAVRVVEARARRSRAMRRLGRDALASLAHRSSEARAFVRLRMMRMF
jgi:hypothetical protein